MKHCEGCPCEPCDPRCPEAPEAELIGICSKCGEEIRRGEHVFRFRNNCFCSACADEMTLQDLAEHFAEPGWIDTEREALYG